MPSSNDGVEVSGESGRSPRRVHRQIWLLNTALAAIAGGLALLVGPLPRLGDLDVHTHPLVLAALLAVSEVLVVHVRFRNDAHTFSMAEAVLAIGLLTAAPAELLAAQALGAAVVLIVHRRQPPIKLVFNLAQLLISVSCAVLLLKALLGDGDALAPWGWLTVALATSLGSFVSLVSILAVLRITTGTVAVRNHLGAAAYAVANSLASTSLGLAAVVLLSARPETAVLLAIPAASVFVANLAYVSQREKHQRLEFLYESTQILSRAEHLEDGLVAVLQRTCDTMRCDLASLIYLPAETADHVVETTVGADGPVSVMRSVPRDELGDEWWRLIEADSRRIVVPDALHGTALTDAVAVPLEGETRRIGILLIARTEVAVNRFSGADRRMLETLSANLSITVENGRLEQSLAQLQQLEEAMSHRATHDSLTELANRSLFTELVESAFANPGQRVAVMFIDLDDFKSVNDTHGHAAGDALLRETAVRLRTSVGDAGTPARLGGDEFAVLLHGEIGAAEAREVADRILAELAPPIALQGRDVRIKATIGIALGHSAHDADGLLRNADIAMYVAKAAGKGCHRLFHPQMRDVVLHRQDLVERLEGAQDRGEIVIHYQPIVDLATGTPRGAEALVRWQHPVHGLLSPSAFIELAEETGKIVEITRYVLEAACVEAASWDERVDAPNGSYVSVNLSARDFREPHLVRTVERTLQDTGLPAHRLLLEVTESALQNEVLVTRTLTRIRDLGVRIAIDDFGTGFSSLSRLRSLPFDVVKIAEPLVANADKGGRDRDFAQLLVDLARILDVDAIAEGIETAAQASVLRQLGFTAAQGHYYSPSQPGNDLWASWRLSHNGHHPDSRERRNPGSRRAADISLVRGFGTSTPA